MDLTRSTQAGGRGCQGAIFETHTSSKSYYASSNAPSPEMVKTWNEFRLRSNSAMEVTSADLEVSKNRSPHFPRDRCRGHTSPDRVSQWLKASTEK
jgi:hypothetical protein